MKAAIKYMIPFLLAGCGYHDTHPGHGIRGARAADDEDEMPRVLEKVEEAMTWPDGRELDVPYQKNLAEALKWRNPERVFTGNTTQGLVAVAGNEELGESDVRYGILLPLESSATEYAEQKVTDVEVSSGGAKVSVTRRTQNWEGEWGLLQIEFDLVKTAQGWRVIDIIRKSYHGKEEDDRRLIREASLLREIDRLSQRGR